MTRLTGTRTPAGPTAPALPQALPGAQKRSLTEVQADPRVRLGAGTAALLLTAMAVRRNRVSPCEAEVFRAVNGLPDSLYLPAWAIIQLGTLGATPAAAGAAWLAAGDRAGGPAPRQRRRYLGTLEAGQADSGANQAGDPASSHPVSWQRCRRARLPVRARWRCRRPGRRSPPTSRTSRPHPYPERHPRRGTDPGLRRRPLPLGIVGGAALGSSLTQR